MNQLLTRSIAAILAGTFSNGVAHAQSAPAPESAPSGNQMEEILVTAQRREERAIDVPISVTAVTSDALRRNGITSTNDLTTVVPGLKMDRTGGYSQPAIRGISTQLTHPGSENNVAMYLDGIYQPSQAGGIFDLPDVSQVEVAKGPQGTLFGRNATGGAVLVSTRNPSQTTEGTIIAEYGSFNAMTFKGFVSGGLTDKVSGSIAGYYHNDDGYLRDIARKKDVGAIESSIVRGKLLYEATDKLSILATAYVSDRQDETAASGIPLGGNTTANVVPAFGIGTAVVPTKADQVAMNQDPVTTVKQLGASLKITYDMEVGTITALTGYSDYDQEVVLDADYSYTQPVAGTNYFLDTPESAFSQEINFASEKFGRVSFVAGLFYWNSWGKYDPIRVQVNYGFPTDVDIQIYSKQSAEAYAVYGEMNFDITDKWSVIAGLRYSDETRTLEGGKLGFPPNVPATGGYLWETERKDDGVTPRLSISYKPNEDANLYFTYSEGFKSGVFNTSATSPDEPSVAPEEVKAYEIGFKQSLNSLRYSMAAFYYDYQDMQVQGFQEVNGVPLSVLQNAATAEIYGAEIEGVWQMTDSFEAQLGVAYTNATFDEFERASIVVPVGGNFGNTVIEQDVSGNDLVRAPRSTVNLTGLYNTTVMGGDLALSGTVYYSDKFYFENGNRIYQPSFTTVNARAAWSPADSGFTFALLGKNLTDEETIQGAFIQSLADGVSYAAPRTWAIAVEYRF